MSAGLSKWYSLIIAQNYFPLKKALCFCVYHTMYIFIYIYLHIFTDKMLMPSLKIKFENTLDKTI